MIQLPTLHPLYNNNTTLWQHISIEINSKVLITTVYLQNKVISSWSSAFCSMYGIFLTFMKKIGKDRLKKCEYWVLERKIRITHYNGVSVVLWSLHCVWARELARKIVLNFGPDLLVTTRSLQSTQSRSKSMQNVRDLEHFITTCTDLLQGALNLIVTGKKTASSLKKIFTPFCYCSHSFSFTITMY